MEEHETGIRCVAAPVFDYSQDVIGSISLAAVVITLGARKIEEFAEKVMEAARLVSESLGACK